MRNAILIVITTAALILAAAGPARSATSFSSYEEPSVSQFGFTLGYMTGMTLYHISSYDTSGSGVESELEFPLNTMLFGIAGSHRSAGWEERGGFQFDYRWLMNLGDGSGKMKDSDWLTDDLDIFLVGSANPGLDIYSESDIDLKAMLIDLRLSYDMWSNEQWHIGPLVGLVYEKFSYDVRNVNQVGYGPYAASYSGSVPGLVLTYEVTYTIPVVGLRSVLLSGPTFEAQLDLGYSPWVSAEDTDDHLLRLKRSEASTKGNAILATVSAQWETGKDSYLSLRGQYLKTETKGTQSQVFYDGSGISFSGIDDRIDSEQTTVYLLITTRL